MKRKYENHSKSFDVVVVGGGILGVTISFWLSDLFDCSIALIEKEGQVAKHSSSRNTGMIHRPFYLNPQKKKIFARASQKSYFLWKALSERYHASWAPFGTLEVALNEEQVKTLDQYKEWGMQNGIDEAELKVLSSSEVQGIENEVRCLGAILSKTDTSVDYAEFSNIVFEIAQRNKVQFIGGFRVARGSDSQGGAEVELLNEKGTRLQITAKFLINAAGGGSIDIAHQFGLGKEYTDLHFRGEYWRVDDPFASKISRSVYSVARHQEYPFLDPHMIVRASGVREIGPNAVLVAGPNAYRGLSEKKTQLISKIFERPLEPKIRLFTDGGFLSLVRHEWYSSLSKKAMCNRVKKFIPSLEVSYLNERGLAGIRNSVIDNKGFVTEAILLDGISSIHILNYNSPGATGAPSFSAYVVSNILKAGHFDGLKRRIQTNGQLWKFEEAANI